MHEAEKALWIERIGVYQRNIGGEALLKDVRDTLAVLRDLESIACPWLLFS
jgi:hypothetical protein